MIRLRSAVLRPNRRRLLIGLLALVCAALLSTHGALGMDHGEQEGTHEMGVGDGAMGDAMSFCLAVLGVAGVVLLGAGLPRRSTSRLTGPAGPPLRLPIPLAGEIVVRSRAGPAELQVFRL